MTHRLQLRTKSFCSISYFIVIEQREGIEADKSFSLIPLAVDDIHHRVDVIFKNELIFPIKAIHFVCTVMSPMLGVPKGRKASN